MKTVRRIRNASILGIFALLPLCATAQNTTGEIDGLVVDSTGAAIPGAVITIVRLEDQQKVREVKSNSKGEYSAPLLNVGTYTIAVSAPGFQQTRITRVIVNVGDTLPINATLQPGEVTDTVTVEASTVAPDTETATQGTVIDEQEMKELALNTRNFQQMVLLQPGVSYTGDDQNYPGQVDANGNANTASISINGLRPTQLSWSLDGSDILNQENSAQTAVFPSVDSIQQTKTLRNSYGAQYGGGGSAQIITVTKGGTSSIRGSAYFFFRNQYLNANSFLNKAAVPQVPRPPAQQNIVGGTIGGPVYIPHFYPKERSRTFFFFGEDIRLVHLFPSERINGQPSIANLNGYVPLQPYATQTSGKPTCYQFSTLVTTSPYPDAPCKINVVQSPLAAAYIKDILLPETLANPINVANNPHNLIIAPKSTTASYQENFRLDHTWNPHINSFVRYIFDPVYQKIPNGYQFGLSLPGVGNSEVFSYGENLTVHTTFALKATVMEFGYSYLSSRINSRPVGSIRNDQSPDVLAATHLPYVNQTVRAPTISINNQGFGSNGELNQLYHTQQGFVNVTKQVGRHTFYYGGNYEHFYSRRNQGSLNAGRFNFSGAPANPTKLPLVASAAYDAGFINFWQGTASAFTQASLDPISQIAQNLTEVYLQDNFRIAPRLTLNFGVRWSHYAQPYDNANHLGGLNPLAFNRTQAPTFDSTGAMCVASVPNSGCASVNPNYNILNGIITGGANSPFGRAVTRGSYLNFAPRVGFAYDLYGDGKTSIRGGYGIFYNHAPLTLTEAATYGNPAYVQTLSISGTTLDNPVLQAETQVLNISGFTPYWTTPYTQSFSLDLQQQLAHNFLLDIAYVGNTTQHLQGEEDLNELQPGLYNSINPPVYNTTTGYYENGLNGAANANRVNYLRPFPGYGPINYFSTRFFGDYHSLQAQVIKRFSRRGVTSVNYTWSKSMANSSGESGGSPQNRYDLKSEWGPTTFDRRHLLTAHVVYDLPFFEKQRGFLGHIFGGYEVSAIIQMRAGARFTPNNSSQDIGGLGYLAAGSNAPDRPSQIGDPNTGKRTIGSFFNTAAFQQFSTSPDPFYIPRSSVGGIVGPGYQNITFDLFRNIKITEKSRLQLRAEAFNVLNRANFRNVGIGVNNVNFGTVTNGYDNRQLQLGAKLYF